MRARATATRTVVARAKRAGKRNLTLKVDVDALARARALAARQGVTLSELFERLTEAQAGRLAAARARKRELIELADKGLALGGHYASDEELYGR
jgi:hypothetical protein